MRIEHLADGTIVKKLSPIQGVPKYGDWLKALLKRGAAHLVTTDELDEKTGQRRVRIEPHDRHQEQATIMGEQGKVGIICIGCAEPIFDQIQQVSTIISSTRRRSQVSTKVTHRMQDRIRIGGLIQFPNEEAISATEIIQRWKVQPVFKMGIGCPACQVKFMAVVAETEKVNRQRAEYANVLVQLRELRINELLADRPQEHINPHVRCLHGLPEAFCAVCNRNKGIRAIEIPDFPKLPMPLTPFLDVFDQQSVKTAEALEGMEE